MRFFYNKHAIPLLAVWLLLCLVLVCYAHNEAGHARDIGVVFGFYSKDNTRTPITPHGKQMREEVGEIIADLIDKGAGEFHSRVNKEIGEIICGESKYYSLYIKGYNLKISDLNERITRARALLDESDRGGALSRLQRKEAIQALLSISEEMQNDFFFNHECSVRAFNVESTLIKSKRYMDLNYNIPSDNVRSAFEELKDTLDRIPEMSQIAQDKVEDKIKDLAAHERLFKWGKYGHRLYFHWGMDVIISKFSPLNVCVEDCIARTCKSLKKYNEKFRREEIEDLEKLQKDLSEKIYSLLEKGWNERKQEALKELRRCLRKYNYDKYTLKDNQCEMLLKLAYYVHILGDYKTSNTSALIPENEIKEALKNKILEDEYWGHKKGNERMTNIRNGLDSMNTAKDMLEFLKEKDKIPDLIDGSPEIRNALWGKLEE